MKILVLTALLAAVASGRLSSESQETETQWPWQVGQLYRYEVDSRNLARLPEGASTGSVHRATFVIRVKAPGHLLAKLENLQRAQVHEEWKSQRVLPKDLKFEPVKDLDMPFEIKLKGGRVHAMSMPSSMSLAHENLLKGLISTLQVDLSTHRTVHHSRNNYDQETRQGQFRKMETDVTGDCDTLYTVSPAASEARREIPVLHLTEDLMLITKNKNYGHCHHRVAYHFGVPEAAEWTGAVERIEKQQFINRATNTRILAGKQGPIYKAKTTNTIHVHPYLYGQQKAEILSYVKLTLVAFEQDKEPEWQVPEGSRVIQSLLYSMSSKQIAAEERSDESYEHESAEAVDSEQLNRVSRSLNVQNKISFIHKFAINKRRNYDDTENTSDGDSTSAYVNDDTPDSDEPAYAALYMHPQNQKPMNQNPANAQKLVQESAQLLQNINNMPKTDFLSKFNILVRVIAAMDSEQLTQTSRSIEMTKASNNVVKADMWMIYRDAVAQAGTLPAFKQILSWIQTKKIQGEEAAQVVATLPKTLRYPTKNIMKQFFELAMSPEVAQQQYLHNTALIAATKFINMGQVNNYTAHSFYPTHMYGRLAHKHDRFVLEDILPRLRQGLEQAIQQQDSRKAQVYIKAIGLLGHRSIIDVFAPYLEGKIPVSTYLRALMVDNLLILANERDGYVRAVLFSILKNVAEHDEVRLAAIQNVFVARPTSSMMQAMAQMTHDDPSIQVRAAIKFTIESAAELQNPKYLDLATTAQDARPKLTKEKFGLEYSFRRYNEYFDNEYDLGILEVVSTYGSDDSVLPKFLHVARNSQTDGWNMVSMSVSSVQRLVEMFQEQMNWKGQETSQKEVNHKYSARKISEMLDIKRPPQNAFEAALFIGLLNQQRYFTFSEQDLKELPVAIKKFSEDLAKGVDVDVHHTKVFNQAQISVMFPMASGMPFIYKYKEPTVLHIQAKVNGMKSNVEGRQLSADFQGEIQFTYARNIDGSAGFLDTLTNQIASTGVVNKVQLNIPMKVNVNVNEGVLKMQLQHLRPEQDTSIAHYSVWPYTTIQKKDTLVPISLDPSTKLIMRPEKVVSMDSRLGQAIGAQYQVQGYSYSRDYRNVGRILQSSNLLSDLMLAVYQKDVAQTHFNFKYLGSKSQNKGVTMTAAYDVSYNMKENSQKPLTAVKMQIVTPNSSERRAEMVKRVASGYKSAKAQVIDLSASFDGPQKTEYVLTAAIAQSPVDRPIQYAFFASRNSAQGNNQINGVGKVEKPEEVYLNAQEALQKEMKMTFEAEIKYGENENGNIMIKGQTERTKKSADTLKDMPFAKTCAEQMARNNFYQHECHKMIVMAQAPDYLKASVSYKDVSPAVKYAVFQMYKTIERYSKWDADVNPLKTTPEGKLEIEIQNNYLQNIMNLNLNSKYGEVRVKNVPIPPVTSRALATYYPLRPYERLANYYTRHFFQPYCTVDGDQIKTFSRRTVEYTLSPAWHVVMQDAPKEWPGQDELVVLARRPSEKQQEIYISYQSETGQDLEIEIQPSSGKPKVQVKTSAKKISEGDLTMYWDEADQVPFLQYFTKPDGVLMLNIRENRLRVMYDGQRMVVLARDGRNTTRGICGLMNGKARDDYWTPRGLVDSDKHFAASYALKDGSDEKTQQLQAQALEMAYQREHKYTSILKSDSVWRKRRSETSSEESREDWSSKVAYRTRSHLKQPRGTCVLTKQVQYYVTSSQICITTTPLEACSSHCKGEGYKIQPAHVVCSSKLDQQFQEYVNQINQGQNPEVSGVPQIRQYRVPASCRT